MEWVSKHDIWFAILVAVVIGVVVGIVVDFFSIGSRMREGVRILRNKSSEQSVALLRARIQQLKDYQKNLMSDRWRYLLALQGICLTLTMFGLGAFFWLIASAVPFEHHPVAISNVKVMGLCLIATGGGIALTTFGQTLPNTQEKVQAVVRKVALETEGLEKQLNERLAKLNVTS